MLRLRAILCVVALVATAAWAAAWVVEPGKGVGTLTLGMTPEQIASQLTATETIGSTNNPKWIKYGGDILVEYSASKAIMITLNKATVSTKAGPVTWTPFSGAGIGTPWSNAENSLGKNYVARDLKVAKSQARESYYAYTSKGLGFRTRAGVIVQVDVWNAH